MEFATDLLAGLRGKVHGTAGGVATPGFDWSGLHARLAAAHAARREMACAESPLAAAAGSFAQWRGTAAWSGKELQDVNPTDSADGKAPAGMEGEVARHPVACGRGQE